MNRRDMLKASAASPLAFPKTPKDAHRMAIAYLGLDDFKRVLNGSRVEMKGSLQNADIVSVAFNFERMAFAIILASDEFDVVEVGMLLPAIDVKIEATKDRLAIARRAH